MESLEQLGGLRTQWVCRKYVRRNIVGKEIKQDLPMYQQCNKLSVLLKANALDHSRESPQLSTAGLLRYVGCRGFYSNSKKNKTVLEFFLDEGMPDRDSV